MLSMHCACICTDPQNMPLPLWSEHECGPGKILIPFKSRTCMGHHVCRIWNCFECTAIAEAAKQVRAVQCLTPNKSMMATGKHIGQAVLPAYLTAGKNRLCPLALAHRK